MRPLANHLILIAGTLFLILPVWMLVMASTQPAETLAAEGPGLLPGTAGLANYAAALDLRAGLSVQITLPRMMANSLVLALGIAGLTTLLSLASAYALVFFRLRGAGFLLWLSLATLLLPIESRFLATFDVTARLGLVDTGPGLILPALVLGLGTLFLRQSLMGLPGEVLEAARLDGAGPFRFWRDFILPLAARPAGAVFVVTFMTGWNQYLWPLLITTDERRYTLMRGLRLVGVESGAGLAMAVFSMLPALGLVVVFQAVFFTALGARGRAF